MPLHLLFPLFSSVVFVLGMMLVKRGTTLGVSPWTGTFLGNAWLALFWSVPAFLNGTVAPTEAWGQAAVIGGLFVLGQLFTYLAFQFGDVSVATPVFGVKVLMVALLVSALAGEAVPGRVWIASALATVGVILVQSSGSRSPKSNDSDHPSATSRFGLTIGMALLAAFCLSLFDVLLKKWGTQWNSREFLPVAFAVTGILSCGFLPWVDRPKNMMQLKALRWIVPGTMLMAMQAVSMSWSLSTYGDATRINIVYALRGLWGVLLAWGTARYFAANEAFLAPGVMLRRLTGAVLLTVAVVVALV
ncbi:MAG: hypothetical protein R3C20_14105 [Planctomycetaceae bacterium]